MSKAGINDPDSQPSRAYLLRLWRAGSRDAVWRASLEDPRTGERIGFPCIEQLFAYLMEQIECETKEGRNVV